MLYAAVLQHFIFKMSPCHDNEPAACVDDIGNPWPANINVWVVSGPYILVGMSEIFASITSLEYAFTKAPLRMKSVVMAFSQFQVALSSALNFALTAVNIEPRFAWLFGSFGVTAWIVGTLFFIVYVLPPFHPVLIPGIDPIPCYTDSDLSTGEKSSSMLSARASVLVSLTKNLLSPDHDFLYVVLF